MKLIDADALKESLEELEAESNSIRYTQGLQDAIDYYFPQIIDDAPTIDAEPIVHAHWIEKTDWYFGVGQIHCTCSNCGYTVDYKPGSRGDGRGGKFCDDCGAMMDEKPEAE